MGTCLERIVMQHASVVNQQGGSLYVRFEKEDHPFITEILAHFIVIIELTVLEWYDGGDHWLVLVQK